jgi:2-polyprenyl-3-methyl-5-hydroxy-6-metoxy-1,4-benzoquinol methylase
MATPSGGPNVTPERIFAALQAFQRSAALKAAVDVELFTAIGEGAKTAAALAQRCKAAERGIRILADYLVIDNFLTKTGSEYGLTEESAAFLDRRSPMYLGSASEFLVSERSTGVLSTLTESVRNGGRRHEESTMTPDDPVWILFARGMMPMMFPMGQMLASIVKLPQDRETKVLDIAASHGIYGIQVALANPRAKLVAVDWRIVLELTKENANKFGVADRFSSIAGSAFDVDFGGNFDLILIPNFLHHFDIPTCETFLKKCWANLRSGGQVAIVEFVPNEDRVSPPVAAGFSLTMLGNTERGDAYTESQYQSMLKNSGFNNVTLKPMAPMPETLVVATN